MSADTLIYTDAVSYSESWQTENESLMAARKRGGELGITSPTTTAAAMLGLLAAAVQAKAIVEVGTGVGVTGLRLLDGLSSGGVLTTIDADANSQGAAKDAFGDGGGNGGHARLITGQPAEVLPRLADGAYDMVVINKPGPDPQAYLDQAIRLLRDGGVVVFGGAFGSGASVTDATQRDPETMALRALGTSIRDNDRLREVLLPIGDGFLAAIKRT